MIWIIHRFKGGITMLTREQVFETLQDSGLERYTGGVKDCLIGLSLFQDGKYMETKEYESIVKFVFEYFGV